MSMCHALTLARKLAARARTETCIYAFMYTHTRSHVRTRTNLESHAIVLMLVLHTRGVSGCKHCRAEKHNRANNKDEQHTLMRLGRRTTRTRIHTTKTTEAATMNTREG